MTKDKLNELDVLIHGASARIENIFKETESSLLLGEALEFEHALEFLKEAKEIINHELNLPVVNLY